MAHVHVAQQESSSAASTNLAVRRVNGQKGLERTSLERFLDLRRHHHDPLKRTFLAAVFGHTALTFTDFHLDDNARFAALSDASHSFKSSKLSLHSCTVSDVSAFRRRFIVFAALALPITLVSVSSR